MKFYWKDAPLSGRRTSLHRTQLHNFRIRYGSEVTLLGGDGNTDHTTFGTGFYRESIMLRTCELIRMLCGSLPRYRLPYFDHDAALAREHHAVYSNGFHTLIYSPPDGTWSVILAVRRVRAVTDRLHCCQLRWRGHFRFIGARSEAGRENEGRSEENDWFEIKKLFKFDLMKFLWQPNQSFLQRPRLILHNYV